MYHIYADDGRILTSPKELEPLLKGTFPAFSKTVGHIRFFYVADEIWDGKSSLIFDADGEQLAAITLDDGVFTIHIADEYFRIVDDNLLDTVYDTLRKNVPAVRRRPADQLSINLNDPNEVPCGYRCDMCLGSKKYNENKFSPCEDFVYMNWLCYHNCVPGMDVGRGHGVFVCPGCESIRNEWKDCRYVTCPTEKGCSNCVECGAYHSCDIHRDSHYPGQCNLGITAEEVTSLVIPYCVKERLDILRNAT